MYSKKIVLKSGEVLFREGDEPNTAYLIETGTIEVQTQRQDELVVIGTLGQGDLLGEMAIIDNARRTATAIAIEDSTLLEINRAMFADRLAKSDPIVRSLLRGLLKRYRGLLSHLHGNEMDCNFDETTILERITVDKIRLEAQLHEALKNNLLDVRYQAILDVEKNRVAGYEALVRWNHPERGLVSPLEFIALAEETNLILEVGDYVIDTACKAVAQFIAAGAHPKPFIAVNVSAQQLSQPNFIPSIAARVAKAQLPPYSLKIEITESQALDLTEVQRTIELCHQHKIKVALDDFGTGYSNLTQLHKLNLDTIKIDQAFTRGFASDNRSTILVHSIVDMCKALGAEVLVEGIENEAMLELLRELDCKYAQGFHIGKPLTLDALIDELV